MTATGMDLPGPNELYDLAPCALLLTSGDGLILRCNRTFVQWCGRDAEELVGRRRIQELFTMGARIFHQTHWAPLLRMQGSVAEVKIDIVHRDGRVIPMMMNAISREHEGALLHEIAITVATDRNKYERELLRERKRAEELLARQMEIQEALTRAHAQIDSQRIAAEDRALFAEQMVGIVSHDLRNPLNAILLGADILRLQKPTDEQRLTIGRIARSGKRANRLISDLLDFTQARLGPGLKIERKTVELAAFVGDCVEELSHSFPGRTLVHDADVAGDTGGAGSCAIDGDRIFQLIGNLVANAFAHGAVDTPVTVFSTVSLTAVDIAVHNFGAPIAAGLLATLFEPMTRGTDLSSESRSVGLGLFIVREIAQAHGGGVTVTSLPEAGTTFRVVLPKV
jgi:sigma-B regulation protein RsbU (phosphoserine phosphatase)